MIWSGKTIAVCASGPSLTQEVADRVRALGVPIIVTNDTWRRIPTADVLFAANAKWWDARRPRVAPLPEQFAGERFCCQQEVRSAGVTFIVPRSVAIGGNSALRACHFADDRGAARILLFGVDLRDDALTHWHGLHRGLDNPNWTTFKRHRAAWTAYAANPARPEIINCNPASAVEDFPKEAAPATAPAPAARRPTVMLGMHGIGDNLHERAIVRELLRDGNEVWLKTSWPQLYWDLRPALRLAPLNSPITWMAKNEQRCAALYDAATPPENARTVRCAYPWPEASRTSVLAAMAKYCGVPLGDFRLPVAPAWLRDADELLDKVGAAGRQLLITRPLLQVVETRSPRSTAAKLARNPNAFAYAALFERLRERYFVISIADAQPGVESVVTNLDADIELHRGEVDIETLAGLVARAALVYTSPCFLTVLAQAVETPLVCVFGGFEGANSFAAGARFSRWLPIEPIRACHCWDWRCRHDKTIDLPRALAALDAFTEGRDASTAYTEHARQPAATAVAHASA
jgi:hypothetical protein